MATISRKVFIISTIIATGILAFSYASRGLWLWFLFIILCGLLLILGQRFRLRWTGDLGLILFFIAVSRCAFLKTPPEWLLLTIVATLSIWDLHTFIGRLNQAGRVEKASDLEQRHLRRLIIISGLGLLLGWVALKVDMKITFGWMLFLGIALILGLSRFIERLGREGD